MRYPFTDRTKLSRAPGWSMAILLALAACGPRAVVAVPGTPTAEPTPAVSPTQATRPQTAQPVSVLRLWLPASMRPDASTPGGIILGDRIAGFEAAHPGLHVDVRIKAESGPGGLREMLGLTALAAPGAVPDVVALDQSDLQAASLKHLVVPLDDSSLQAPNQTVWAPFAQSLSQMDGAFVGLPFAGDCEVLVQTQPTTTSPILWGDLLGWHRPLYVPLADPKAIFLLSDYLAAGGQLPMGLTQITLSAAALTSTLSWLGELSKAGVLSSQSAQITSYEQALEMLEGGGQGAIASYAGYAAATRTRGDLSGSLPPSPAGQSFTLVSGWSWALATPDPQRRQLAVELIVWLSDPKFVGTWTRAQGVLPARLDALSWWPADATTQLARACLTSGRLYPSDQILTTFAPVLSQAAESVVTRREDPGQAAAAAVNSLRP